MTFSKLNTLNVTDIKRVALMFEEEEAASTTYETRIKSDGKVEATDTITK